jgi:hypothetical protein
MIRLDDAKHRQALTLPQACQWIGDKTGKTPATSTAWRWVLRGVRGGIKLESFRIGGTTYTTPEMLSRFVEQTTNAIPTSSTPAATAATVVAADHETRRREIAAAQERLREICKPKRGSKPRDPQPNVGRSR